MKRPLARGMPEKPITTLIDAWPTRKVLAEELGASEAQVHKWAKFGRIPSEWQFPMVEAARRNGRLDVTPEWMLRQHHEQKRGSAA